MNLIEEIKNVDPNNPGGWPLPIKIISFIALFLMVIVAGALLDWKGQMDTLTNLKNEEVKKKAEFVINKKTAINLVSKKKQLLETDQSFSVLLKQLPSKSEMDALLTDINQAGLGRGLQFDLFRPGAEVATGVLTEQPISIRVSGNYDDLGKFSSDISQLPRIVTLNDISITQGANGLLNMEATAKTYRYLDTNDAGLQQKKTQTPAGGAQ
jgi:type IV pilus assembly protein PilO